MTKFQALLKVSLSSLLIIAVASTMGCGDAGPATVVSGKVTTGGQPVTGFIHFVGSDGKEVAAPVGPSGGTYMVTDPPLGEVTVLVKGVPGSAVPTSGGNAPAPGTGGGTPMMKMPGGTDATTATTGVPPPAKYADASGGLKYTVTAGKQQKDFELAP
jgi:hypothetical protein